MFINFKLLREAQTQLSGKSGKAQLERNLSLTIDWNREDIALSEIFQRDDYTQIEIKHAIFEKAILRLDREKFVELFLDQGFYIHRYLGRNNIRDLFERTEKRDFFTTVVLQGILGHNTVSFNKLFYFFLYPVPSEYLNRQNVCLYLKIFF
jgi:hypothetical protein